MLTTARLELRCAALEDAAFLLRLLNDPSWLENIGDRGVRTSADAERYIRDNLQAPYRSLGYGMYVVQLRESAQASTPASGEPNVQPHAPASAQPIGLCGLVKRAYLPDPDLGFALLPEFVGFGYASEAARAVLRHAQLALGLGKLYAIVKRGNQRSEKLLEALGFRHQGPYALPQGSEVELYVTT